MSLKVTLIQGGGAGLFEHGLATGPLGGADDVQERGQADGAGGRVLLGNLDVNLCRPGRESQAAEPRRP